MMGRLLGNFKLLGILFLGLVVLSAWLTYAIFTKKFVTYEEVTLETSNVGLALPARADVKIRGVIVGEVLEATAAETRDSGAQLLLGLYPDSVDTIPANVTASIVPKTLFGEKYVSLIVPDQPDSQHIEAGDTITKTVVATEVEEVLNDLYPLLTTVQPADLNMTLNAVATALEGRGDQLGENLETVDSYLKRLNPQIPALVEDLRLTAEVSDTYSDILPQVGTILENTITTTGTLEGREQQLNALFDDVASLSATTQTFLDENGDELVRLSDVSAEQLSTLARYAPEFPCLTQGLVNVGKRSAESFRGFTLHIVLETLPRQPRRYTPADRPELGEDRGANCVNLPNPPWSQENPVKRQPDFQDGVDEPTGKGTSRVAPDYSDLRFAGTVSDNDVVRRMLAESGGVDSDLGVLLAGPLMVEPDTGGER
ncbi:MCE family protein [Nocardioides nanhaiensis]|uniref:MCE family protein n=1 Tax=Nocardioides nanhaiensis TaxID=1476871 RepID=A0ABP8W7L5_9ACTN